MRSKTQQAAPGTAATDEEDVPESSKRGSRSKGRSAAGAAPAAVAAPAPDAATSKSEDIEPQAKPRKRQKKDVVVPEPVQRCWSVGSGVHVGTSGYRRVFLYDAVCPLLLKQTSVFTRRARHTQLQALARRWRLLRRPAAAPGV